MAQQNDTPTFQRAALTAWLQVDNDTLQPCSEKECHTSTTAEYRTSRNAS